MQATERKKELTKYVAGFGAALAASAVTMEADASIHTLTADVSCVTFNEGFGAGNFIDLGLPGTGFADFVQFNSAFSRGMLADTYATFGTGTGTTNNTFNLDIVGFRQASFGAAISNGMVFDQFVSFSSIYATQVATGSVTYGFLTRSNHVGWIRLNLGDGTNKAVKYIAAAWEDEEGETIDAGEVAPEPTSLVAMGGLGMLALGATGVRRNRRRRSESK